MTKMDSSGESIANLARAAVTAIALGQAVVPLFIDLNRTHAKHPMWPGHARFHVVWQTATAAMLGALEVGLIWWPGRSAADRFYLAALLAALPLLGFLAALATRRRYMGTLHDPLGVKPVQVRLGARVLTVDMNIVLVVTAAVLLPAATLLFHAVTAVR